MAVDENFLMVWLIVQLSENWVGKGFKISDEDRKPPGIVLKIHLKEKPNQSLHGIWLELEIALPMSPDEEKDQLLVFLDQNLNMRWSSAVWLIHSLSVKFMSVEL